MARTCVKCGSAVGDKARFCGKCGEVLQVAQPSQASAEKIPTWSGWDTPAAPPTAALSQGQQASGQQTSAVRFSKPRPVPTAPAQPAATPAQNAAPQPGYAPPSAQPQTSQASGAYYSTPNQTDSSQPSNAPQFWESYDYQGSSPAGQSEAYRPSSGSYEPRSDASRPLPKLDDLLGSNYSSPSDAPRDGLSFDDLDDEDLETRRAKAYDTITTFSLWCAGLVLFPMPFMDLVFLVPIQSAMVVAVGKIYGVQQTPEKTVAVLAGSCGASVFGQFTTLFLANFIPVVGKLLSAPFIFGWSYGMGEVAIRYFESKGTATKDELKQIFKKASKEASKNYDGSRVSPREALENIRNYVSEDEYRKIRERFGPANS